MSLPEIRFIFELFKIALTALGLFKVVQKRNSGLLIPNYPLSHIITSTNNILKGKTSFIKSFSGAGYKIKNYHLRTLLAILMDVKGKCLCD